jgi:putative tryptophan/tyrosine transport system substrate-binding protein
MMTKVIVGFQLLFLSLGASMFAFPAVAQQRKTISTLGWIWYGASPSVSTLESAVIDGLRELGYVEGKNLKLEHRFAHGKHEQFLELAGSLAAQKVDVILTIGGDITAAAKKATANTPIVMGVSEDPVRASLVASLARPGGNITGVSFLSNELAGKRVEFLKEISPKLSRIAVLWNPAHFDEEFKEIQNVAHTLGVQIQSLRMQRLDAMEGALTSLGKESAQALVVIPSRLTSISRSEIGAAAIKLRIPMISGWREFAEAGAVVSYGPDRTSMARRLAYYIDRILKGAKSADLPVEQPSKFELVINLKTANQIGLSIPSNVLVRADQVIR